MDLHEVVAALADTNDWREKARIVFDYHSHQQRIHGVPGKGKEQANGWSIRDTAKALEISPATVFNDLKLHVAIQEDPDRFIESNRQAALTIIFENRRSKSKYVSITRAKRLTCGHVIYEFEYKGMPYYVIKLDRPIDDHNLAADLIAIKAYNCRSFIDDDI